MECVLKLVFSESDASAPTGTGDAASHAAARGVPCCHDAAHALGGSYTSTPAHSTSPPNAVRGAAHAAAPTDAPDAAHDPSAVPHGRSGRDAPAVFYAAGPYAPTYAPG